MAYPADTGQRPLQVREAYAALEQFVADHGREPLLLLMHAAVPESLRPDLLNLIHSNFLPDRGSDPSVEADVLFSPLSTALGGGYYRIDPQVRWHCLALLRSLYRDDPRPRAQRVAELLWRYVEALEKRANRIADSQLAEYLDIQRWVALGFLQPDTAAEAFAAALHQACDPTEATVKVRLGGLASAMELPLGNQPELITYARGLDALAAGEEDKARSLFSGLGKEEIRVGKLVLKPASFVEEIASEDDNEPLKNPEVARLLAELDNPNTTPPRRLEIGDRLAELGDPRPGVGVVEIEIPSISYDWQRLQITSGTNGGLRYSLTTDRVHIEVEENPDQRQAVDGLIATVTNTVRNQPDLTRNLFELLVPNDIKKALSAAYGLVIGVDVATAVYPWELMHDDREENLEPPLVARIGVVRELISPYRRIPVTTAELRALVVGDTQSGLDELPGAQQEARTVASLLQATGFATTTLFQPDGETLLHTLFRDYYRVIHLAAHGTVADGNKRVTGIVLGPNIILNATDISQMRRVPELVFINCCHLGITQFDVNRNYGELAANLATSFIEIGIKAVVTAGWPVSDAAAITFADTFYRVLLDGNEFGDAVLKARAETWRLYPDTNTWGAYQAYGDKSFRLMPEAPLSFTGGSHPRVPV